MSGFHTTKTVTARKPHVCEEHACKRLKQIEPGTQYVVHAGCYDGEFYNAKLCIRCDRLHAKVWERYGEGLHPDERAAFGELLNWIRGSR